MSTRLEFLALLGHELRNSLGSIKTALRVLTRLRIEDGRILEMNRIIERQTLYMERIISDLLDLSRLGRDQLELKKELVDLRDLIRNACIDYRTEAQLSQLKLECSVPTHAVWAEVDPVRINQVLSNLIKNSIKFTKTGLIEISLDATGKIIVRDTGPGFASDVLPHIFEAFEVFAHKISRSGGLGLGLALAKGIIDLHAGTITASNVPAGGAEIIITIPLNSSGATDDENPGS